MDKRHQRMLEEVLTLPGNETCADCHAGAPRWASVNLGIFLCVNCASVHRKLGTHKSRVKSVTLDSWSREQIVQMRNTGNRASNALYNPNEALHPPPTNSGAEDRDSEIEKYIRRKYEMGAFKAGVGRNPGLAPTSLNRAKERDGRLPIGSVTGPMGTENRRNPELNDVLIKKAQAEKDRDLPALPPPNSATSNGYAPPRTRPTRSTSAAPSPLPPSNTTPYATNGYRADGGDPSNVSANVNGSTSSTLPLQVNGYGGTNPFTQMNSTNPFPVNSFSTSPKPQASNHLQIPQNGYGYAQQALSYSAPAHSTLASFDPLSPQSQQQQLSQQQMFQQNSYNPSPSFSQHQQFSASPTPSFHSQMGTSPTPSFHSQFDTSPNQGFNQFSQPPTASNGYLAPQYTQQQHQQQQQQSQRMYNGQMITPNGMGYGQQQQFQPNGQWAQSMGMGMAGNTYNGMR